MLLARRQPNTGPLDCLQQKTHTATQTHFGSRTVYLPTEIVLQQATQTRHPFWVPSEAGRKNAHLAFLSPGAKEGGGPARPPRPAPAPAASGTAHGARGRFARRRPQELAVPAAGPAAEEGGARGGGARQRIFGNGELRDGSAPPSSLPSLFCHDLPTPQPPSRPCAGSSSTPATGRP